MKQQGSISRHVLLKSGRWTLLLVGLLLGNLAQAATDYFFHPSSKDLPAGCEKDSGHSYSCGVLTLGEGDTITLGKSDKSDKPDKLVTITFSGAFTTGASNLINASGAVDDLKLVTNGVLTLGPNTLLNANVVGTAAVNLGSASTLAGNLTTSSPTGIVTLAADSKVGGFISSQEGAINLGANSAVGGAVSAGAGVVTLTTGIYVNGDISTVAGGITVGDQSRVCGSISSSGAGVVVLTTNIRVGGSVITQVGAITIGAGSTVGSDVISGGVITLTGLLVGGNVSSIGAGAITATTTSIGGNVSSGAGVITLTNSQVRGTVTSGVAIVKTGSSVGDTNLVINIPSACSTVVVGDIDHFEFLTSSGAHTCSPQTVTVSACTNAAPAACAPYSGNTTVELSSNGWIGGSTKTLVNGVGSFSLQGLAVSMPLGIVSSGLGAKSQPLCKIGAGALSTACSLSFAQSGFSYDVPDMLANKGSTDIVIRALVNHGTPSSAKCEPAFTNTSRDVSFWSDFIDPAGSNLSDSTQMVSVNGSAVGQAAAAKIVVKLAFDDTGSSLLAVNYREAGKMQLSAIYAGSATEGDSGLMIGADQFVARPAGFCLQPQQVCTEDDSSSCPAFRKVGQTFTASLKPVAWQSDSDNDLCQANSTTTNYRQTGLVLAPELVEPNEGVSGIVLLPVSSTYDHLPPGIAAGWNGVVVQNVAFSEVGVFRLSVNPGEYLGSTVAASSSDPIGRFYPTHFKAEGQAQLTPSCSVFSYQGQPIEFSTPPILTVTAYGLDPSGVEYVTRNYDFEGFWTLGTSFDQSYASLDGDDQADLFNRIRVDTASPEWTQIDVDMGDGARSYQLSGEEVSYARNTVPQANDLPFSANIRLTVPGSTLTDSDGICLRGESCPDFSFDFSGSGIRLGRLSIGNAHGSELQPLSLPVSVESWQVNPAPAVGNSFQAEGLDTCTASILGTPALVLNPLDTRTGQLLAKNIKPSVVSVPATPSLPIKLQVAAPGSENHGSVEVSFPDLPSWLHYDWNAKGGEAASGLATFGIYKGEQPLIFRRELYR